MKKVVGIILLCLFFVPFCGAQYQLEVGGWQTHHNYTNGKDIDVIDNNVFYATENTIVRLDMDDNSIHRLDKVSGLHDVSIACIGANRTIKTLVIAYTNGNIDLYNHGFTANISDIYTKQISGDKNIYSITCRDNEAYLACGFGIVVLNLKKQVIKETWFSSINNKSHIIKDICFLNDTIFAMTDSLIFKTSLNNRFIRDFSSWDTVFTNNLSEGQFLSLENFQNQLFLLKSDTLAGVNREKTGYIYLYSPQNQLFTKDNRLSIYTRYIRSCFSNWIVADSNMLYYYTYDTVLQSFIFLQKYWGYEYTAAIRAENGEYYMSGYSGGLLHGTEWDYAETVSLQGPEADAISSMDWQKSKLVVTHGSIDGIVPRWVPEFVSARRGNNWEQMKHNQKRSYFDLLKVRMAPYDTSLMYAASFLMGLIKIKDGVVEKIYSSDNSPIQSVYTYDSTVDFIRTPGLDITFDKQNNLWFASYQTDYALYMLTPDGQWYMPTHSLLSPSIYSAFDTKLFVDSRNWLWITFNRSKSLLLYSTNNTPQISDDRCVNLNLTSLEPADNFQFVYCVAEDRDSSTIWIGTDKGIKLYYSASRLLDNPSIQPQPIKILNVYQTDTLVELLLGMLRVNCITVDAGNRKWVGTDNSGVYLLSEDGKDELFHFTTENSPLLSNNILSICIDGETGEVYFGTDKGLISFRYTATLPKEDYSEIKIFPNPVRPDYNGYINIYGLKENSEVKITDTQGNIAYRTRSNGGSAAWDGICFNGHKAATGVYFVFVCDANGKEKKAGKILFVK
ncbi:MAG: hypothetical protein LBR36_08575 [Bacteroidales bacterium]|jgi:hypothetical protein|nr:hypothetical protein [Bacteroidales bacterium]